MKLLPLCLLGLMGCVAEVEGEVVDVDPDEELEPAPDGTAVDEAGNEPVMPNPEDVTVIYSTYPAVTLATSQVSHNLVKDGSYVYWTNADSVMRVATSGGTPVRMAGSLRAPYGLAIDSSNLYWAEYGNASDWHCYIKKMPKTGGTITKLYAGAYGCAGLTITSTMVYWTNYAQGLVGEINKGGSGLYIANVGGRPREITTDNAGQVLWSNESRGTIEGYTGPSDGDWTTIARGQAPTHLKIAGEYVYWTNFDHGTIMRASKYCEDCGSAMKTIASSQAGPMGIDASGTWLYWTNAVNGTMMKATLPDGLSRTRVATTTIGADKLIVRIRASRIPPSLYWTNPSAKTVMKIDQY